MKLDPQLTIGLIALGLALGWIAQMHGLVPWIREQLTTRRSAWKPRGRDVLDAPDKSCTRDVPQR